MASEMYITAFSKSSDEKYPTNIYSNFSYTLPVPLNLSLDSEWFVGVVNLYYSPILGVVNENDTIIFPNLNIAQVKTFAEFVTFISETISDPFIYSKEYFDDFYNLSNLKNFNSNAAIQKHKCKIPTDSEQAIKINKWAILDKLKETVTRHYHDPPELILFEFNKNYTLNQILYMILKQWVDHIEKVGFTVDDSGRKIKKDAYHKNKMQVHEHLLDVVRTFVICLAREQEKFFTKYYKSGKANRICEMFLHADITAPQNFNNTLARIAYASSAREFHHDIKQIANVSYVPVVKNYIDEITFKFTDQKNNLIIFMNENKETFVRLHFKQKSI